MTFHTDVINCHKKNITCSLNLKTNWSKQRFTSASTSSKRNCFLGEKKPHGSLNSRILPEHVQSCKCRVVVEVEGIEDALNVGGGSLLQDVVSEDPGKGHLDGELDHHLLICSPVHSLTWILLPIVISR